MKYIKTLSGKILGSIEDNRWRLVAKTLSGKILGWYVKDQDVTTTLDGKIIARGNVLSYLIMKEAGL